MIHRPDPIARLIYFITHATIIAGVLFVMGILTWRLVCPIIP